MSVRYLVVVGKNDERAEGPEDAGIVFSVPYAVASDNDFDATIEFMRGKLKAVGDTGKIFELLKSGDAAAALSRLASQP